MAIATINSTTLKGYDLRDGETVPSMSEFALFVTVQGRDGEVIGRDLDSGKVTFGNIPRDIGVTFCSEEFEDKGNVITVWSHKVLGQGFTSVDQAVNALQEKAQEEVVRLRAKAEARAAYMVQHRKAQADKEAQENMLRDGTPEQHLQWLIAGFDKFYNFSDDHGVWQRGKEQEAKILAYAQEHGLKVSL